MKFVRPVTLTLIVAPLENVVADEVVPMPSNATPTGFASTSMPTVPDELDRKSTRLNSSHTVISYAVFCLKKKALRDEHPLCRPRGRLRPALDRRIARPERRRNPLSKGWPYARRRHGWARYRIAEVRRGH